MQGRGRGRGRGRGSCHAELHGGGGGRKERVCVMVSGGGSNLKALHAASTCGRLGGAEIVAVVSDKPGCGGWQFACDMGIPTLEFQGKAADTGTPLEETLAYEYGVDVILLAGFLKLIPASLCERYKRAMLNIHPALLPAFGGKGFYGERVHKAVIASGVRYDCDDAPCMTYERWTPHSPCMCVRTYVCVLPACYQRTHLNMYVYVSFAIPIYIHVCVCVHSDTE